jgi:hypothetical protein
MISRGTGSLSIVLFLALGGVAAAQPAPTPTPTPPPTGDQAGAPAPVDDTTADEPVDDTTTTAEPAPVAVPVAELPPTEPAEAEVEPSSLTPSIAGHVNATWNYNVSDPAMDLNPFHSYDLRHNTFLLNAAHVAITGSDDHLSYAVEIDAGSDAAFNTADDDFDIQEAWVSYVGDSGFGAKIGKAATYMGIEVIESPANPTISRGFLFGLAEPFTHVGGVLTYKVNDQIDVALGLINGWDLPVDNNNYRTIVGKVGIALDQGAVTISGTSGPEQPANNDDWRTVVDVTAVLNMVDKLALWVQANVGTESFGDDSATWWGVGVQPVYAIDDKLSVGGRFEVFGDPDGARTGFVPDGQTLINITAAPAYKLHENFTVRVEARVDIASEDDTFVNSDGDGGTSQILGMTEAIVTF